MWYLDIFRLVFKKAIVILEISTLKLLILEVSSKYKNTYIFLGWNLKMKFHIRNQQTQIF